MNNAITASPLTLKKIEHLRVDLPEENSSLNTTAPYTTESQKLKKAWIDLGLEYFERKDDKPVLYITLLTKTTNINHAIESYRHFNNILRSKMYGRNGLNDPTKQLSIFPVIERHFHNDIYHFHLILGFNQDNISCRASDELQLTEMVKKSWSKISISLPSTFSKPKAIQKVKPGANSLKNLISYMVKNVKKSSHCYVLIDWM